METYNQNESVARDLYTVYCSAVGGQAHDGTPLPEAREFFTNPSTIKQAEGWRTVAEEAPGIIRRHALNNASATMKEKASQSSGWKKLVYIAGSIIAAGLAAAYLTGCGLTNLDMAGQDGGSLSFRYDPVTGQIIVVGTRPEQETPVIIQKGK